MTVPVEFLDENDHMNIGRYLEASAAAVWLRYTEIGMGQPYIDERQLSTFTAEHHLRYYSELRLGDEFSVHVRPLERSAKAIHNIVFLLDRTRERLSFTHEDLLVSVDMVTRRPVDFPEDIAASLDRVIAEVSGLSWAAPVSGAMGIRKR